MARQLTVRSRASALRRGRVNVLTSQGNRFAGPDRRVNLTGRARMGDVKSVQAVADRIAWERSVLDSDFV